MTRSPSMFIWILAFLALSAGPTSAECDPLIVRNTALDRDEYGTRIVGEALHYTEETLENLTLSFALYKRGEGVGGASADRERLEPGDTWNFVARTSTDDFDGYRLAAKFCDTASADEGTASWGALPLAPDPAPWRLSLTRGRSRAVGPPPGIAPQLARASLTFGRDESTPVVTLNAGWSPRPSSGGEGR